MKINAILSLVVVTLACKVSAECFAEELGYSCCVDTTDVVSVDENGSWGMENGIKCGIEPASPQVDVTNTVPTSTTNWSGYMDKIEIENVCPAEMLVKEDDVTYPEPVKVHYFSNTTQSERPMNIILPPNYDSNKKYPVLYYLHGIFCDEDTMLEEPNGTLAIYGNLLKEHRAKEMIIVLPYQYAPAPGTAVAPNLDQSYYDGYDNFIHELIDDIMPYMENHYSVATGRENTAICGFSMGGRNTLYIGYTKSDLFGYIGAFAPAPGIVETTDKHSYHKGLLQPDELVADEDPIVSILACGTNDSVVGNYPEQYHQLLENNHQKHIWYTIPDADHDATAVSTTFYNFLSSIFGILNEEKTPIEKPTPKPTTTPTEKPKDNITYVTAKKTVVVTRTKTNVVTKTKTKVVTKINTKTVKRYNTKVIKKVKTVTK